MNTFVKLLVSMAIMLTASTSVLAESISVVLPNGTSWRGDTSQQVTIQFGSGATGSVENLTGSITKSTDLYIVFRIGDGPDDQMMIPRSELLSISSGDAPAPAAEESSEDTGGSSVEPAGAASEPVTGEAKDDTGVKGPRGVFHLPLKDNPFGGSVGDAIREKDVQLIIAQADKAGPGQIIVLEIESGGGSVTEAVRICETIQEAKDRHTFVSWAGYSISAGAYIALSCDRIVVKSTCSLGAITMHRSGQPVSDEEERRWTTMLEHTLEESGQSPYWAKAMVKNAGWLSYVKDPVTGDCEYFNAPQGIPGEIILSHYAKNCVVTVAEALHSNLAVGRADNTEELAKVLDLQSWNELGSGQELYKDWHNTLAKCKKDLRETSGELKRLGEFNRVTQIKKTIAIYKKWLLWWKKAPEFCLGKIPMAPDLKRMIEELELELRNMAQRP